MRILQSYYTSCRKGQLGGAGFQFYSHSEGLSADELKEISIIGNYVPPLNLPTQPSPKEREQLFPVSFCYFKLKSGRVGVCQSKYVGQDYSGRYGNFFSHCLIMEKGYFPCHPVRLFGHSIFRSSLSTDEEESTMQPPLLPAVNFTDLQISGVPDFKRVSDFLANQPEDIYLQMMNALLVSKEDNRRIVFADQLGGSSAVDWIRSLTIPFPLHLAQDITFSTYSFDPANTNFSICRTLATGTRFQFNNQMARDFQYYLFNLTTGDQSKVKGVSDFVQMLPFAFEFSTDKLEQFHEFLSGFDYQTINQEIDNALGLFNLIQGGRSVERLSFEEIQRFFQFAVSYDSGKNLERLVAFIRSQKNPFSLIHKLDSLEHSLFVIKVLFAGSQTSSDLAQKKFASEFYSDSVLDFIFYKEQGLPTEMIQDFISYNQAIFATPFANSDFFAFYILSPERIKILQQVSEEDSGQVKTRIDIGSAVLYACILKAFSGKKESCEAVKDFLLKKIRTLATNHRNLTPVFRVLASSPDIFFDVLTEARNQLSKDIRRQEELSYCFITIFNESNKDWSQSMERKLRQQNEVELVLLLAMEEIKAAANKVAAFDQYLEERPEFFRKHADRFSGFLLEYARAINLEYPGAEVKKLLAYAAHLSKGEFQEILLQILERGVNLRKPHRVNKEILSDIHQLRKNNKIGASHNGLGYVYLSRRMADDELTLNEFFSELEDLGALSSKFATEVLEWAVEVLCEHIEKSSNSLFLLAFMAIAVESEAIHEVLEIIIEYGFRNDLELITFLITFLAEQEVKTKNGEKSQFLEEQKRVKKSLPAILAKYRVSFKEKVKKIYVEDEVSRNYWSEVWAKAEKLKEENGSDNIREKLLNTFLKRKKL